MKIRFLPETSKYTITFNCRSPFIRLFLMLFLCNYSHAGVTLENLTDNEKIALKEALHRISMEYQVFFSYDQEAVRDVEVRYEPDRYENAEHALNRILRGTSLQYEVFNNRYIILYESSPEAINSLKNMVQHLESVIDKEERIPVSRKRESVLSPLPSRSATFSVSPIVFSVSGTVIDNSGEPLIGVNIQVKGSDKGTATDFDGKFVLEDIDENAVLVVSYVGYQTQEVSISGKSDLEIIMISDSQLLDEVVVVGYGTQKKESVVGAISQIGTRALTMAGVDNVSNSIAGKLSGVLTILDSGEPGNNHSEIIIRGLSSWSGSGPLVMVDGVERDFRFLDPNEIETISVLKDASATAVYGAKGANGVILVTTRRGSDQKPKLSFKTSSGIQLPSGMDYFIDSYTTLSMLNVARMNDQQFEDMLPDNILEEYRSPSSRLNAIRYPNVNWIKEVTRPFAPINTVNVNVDGGTERVKYFASLGYQNEMGVFMGINDGHIDSRHKNNKFNYRANLDFSLTGSTKLSFNLGGDVSVKNNPTTNTWHALANTGPARFPAYFPEWMLDEIPDLDYPDASGVRLVKAFGERYENPYSMYNDGAFRNYTSSRVFTDLLFTQHLDFLLKGLSVQGKASLSTYYNMLTKYSDTRFPQYYLHWDLVGTETNPWERVGETREVYQIPPINIRSSGIQNDYYNDYYYEASINYNNSFGNEEHNVTGLLLFNRQQKNEVLEFPFYNEAWVGRFTYNYKYKYLFEANMGYTGSERFSPNHRFGFFPSGAVGWTISEESFFKDAFPWINLMKLRYSDGLVGSDYAENRWLYISEYYTSGNYIAEDIGANVNAQWEEARKRDFGIDFSFFNNQLDLTIELFDEYRSKMLTEPQNVTFLVGNNFKDLNLGELKKHGFEIEVGWNTITKWQLNYYVSGMMGFNENRIVFRDDLTYAPDYRKYAGKQLGMPEGFNVPLGVPTGAAGVLPINSGYFTSVDDLHNHATPIPPSQLNVGDHVFLDYDVDGIITSRDKYPLKGSQYPPITYSLTSGLNYKGWGLNVMFQGNQGKYVVFNNVFENEFELGSWSVRPTQINYWRPDTQDNADHATLHYFDGGGGIPQYAWAGGAGLEGYDLRTPGHFWRKADYLRLKEVHLEYTFDKIGFLSNSLGVSDLTLYLQGYNILTFTNLILGDPERRDFTRGFYPLMKTFRLGLNASF